MNKNESIVGVEGGGVIPPQLFNFMGRRHFGHNKPHKQQKYAHKSMTFSFF